MKISKKELKRKVNNVCDMLYDDYCKKTMEKELLNDICGSKYYVDLGEYDVYEFTMYGTSKHEYKLKIMLGKELCAIIDSSFIKYAGNTIADAAWRLIYLRIKTVK